MSNKTDISVDVPIEAINSLSLQSLGMYVTLHIFGGDIEMEDVEASLNSLHGRSNVTNCLSELAAYGLVNIIQDDDEEGDTEVDE